MLAQVTPSAVPGDPSEWSLYTLLVAIALAIAAIIEVIRKRSEVQKLKQEVVKLSAEVQKLKTEEIKLAGDVLRELQRARDCYADSCVECGDHARTIIRLIREGADEDRIREAREAFCRSVGRKALHSLCALVEWNALSRKNSPDHLVYYIYNDVIAEIARIANWLETINAPIFTEGYRLTPLRVSEQTARPLYDLIRFVPEEREVEVRGMLFTAIGRLKAGSS